MSVRVGHIYRHEDVHGVSGTGRVADVFEASNGKAIVVWTSANPSVVVYDNAKAVENTHGHGGKTDVVWIFEEEREADPMDAVIERKVEEAGGKKQTEAEAAEAEAEETAEEIAEETAAAVEAVAEAVAEKLSGKIAEKVEQKTAEKKAKKNGNAEK